MFFPEELDNRSFRLFVQRVCKLVKRNMALSRLETKMVQLLQHHPDLDCICSHPVDVDQVFNDPGENPFLKLSALWQVEQQWENDQPRGFRNALKQAFKKVKLDSDEWDLVADAYLTLYFQNKTDSKSLNKFEYIVSLCSLLGESPTHFSGRHTGSTDESPSRTRVSGNIGPSGLVTSLIADCFRSMHHDASSLPVRPQASLLTLLGNLPIDWLDAVLRFWELPEIHLKRDKVKALSAFLTHADHWPMIFNRLQAREKEALKMILDEKGLMTYDRLIAIYGSEEDDGYWWSKKRPQSLIGGLRLKGLLFIGRATVDSKTVHVAVIAKQHRPLLTALLSNAPPASGD